jgi:uncharacterized protein YecT (DUF1311 family)
MRARHVVPALIATGLALAGCTSSGSPASGPAARPTPSAPTSTATGAPVVGEDFTLLTCPKHANSTVEVEGCLEHRIVRLDDRVNGLVRSLYGLKSDPTAAANFAAAQQAWVTYRRAACLSEADAFAGGTLGPVAFANCELRLNKQRLGDLEELKDEANP